MAWELVTALSDKNCTASLSHHSDGDYCSLGWLKYFLPGVEEVPDYSSQVAEVLSLSFEREVQDTSSGDAVEVVALSKEVVVVVALK